MYNNAILPATGMMVAIWLPLAGMAIIALGFALMRMSIRKKQPNP